MMFYVYIFQNKQSYKIYVGKTDNFIYRLTKHRQSTKSPKTYFHKALAKHGLDSFDYFIIEEWETESECFEAEKFWIEFFRSNFSEYGYNLTEGGDGSSGYRHTPDAIEKMRECNRGHNNPHYGKTHSLKTKEKMSLIRQKNHDHHSKMNSGELNPRAKLTQSQVIEIKKLLNIGELSYVDIGRKFGVGENTIGLIKRGKSWKTLPKTSV